MKKAVLIIGSIVLLASIVGALYLFVFKKEPTTPSDQNSPSFPSGGTLPGSTLPAPRFMITGSSNEPIEVKDFRTTPDPYVPGQYTIVGGRDAENAPYDIFYQETDHYFGISLYAEPLGENRRKAEQELRDVLGITEEEMCHLNYVIAPGPGVAETYEGQNLGFSFCPGAVPLP